jgi:hypothetical protein
VTRSRARLFVTTAIANIEAEKFQKRKRHAGARSQRLRHATARGEFTHQKSSAGAKKISSTAKFHNGWCKLPGEKKIAASPLPTTYFRVLVSAPFQRFVAGFFRTFVFQFRNHPVA